MPETAHMTERTFNRVSPLQDVAVQGRFGADKGVVGVSFTVRHPMSIVTVIARAGQGEATAAVLKGYEAQWAGPDQWFVLAQNRGEGALCRELKAKLAGIASVSNQSHGRVIIRLAGPRARAVLAKGTPLHKGVGYLWVTVMLVVASSSFAIHSLMPKGPLFGFTPPNV